MHYQFVPKVSGGDLLGRMLKGGLDAEVTGYWDDAVLVAVVDEEVWADEDAWVRAIEEHYACVFNDSAN